MNQWVDDAYEAGAQTSKLQPHGTWWMNARDKTVFFLTRGWPPALRRPGALQPAANKTLPPDQHMQGTANRHGARWL